MFANIFNWRTVLSMIAIAIVFLTIFFSNFLAKKIAVVETQRIQQWVKAIEDAADPNIQQTNLSALVLTENNKDIPIIFTNEKDSIIDAYNMDSALLKSDKEYLQKKLYELKKQNKPIVWINPLNKAERNHVYYGQSALLKQIKYFPIVQLVIVALFIIITLMAINTRNKSTQNQVWAGMAKETAHQLGTPISSLQGWIEILRDNASASEVAGEMEKDIDRLKLVSDRFGKIGSIPKLEEADVVLQVNNMVNYMRRLAPGAVQFNVSMQGEEPILALMSPQLFDWVLENLLKNALDALNGKGTISLLVKDETAQVIIDVQDSGKGIAARDIAKVFKPGFTTKKRGWGLGLSLSKRIIEHYHRGQLFVKHSEPGKGTTFRIVLVK